MSFVKKLFRRERKETVAFIDIGARSVAGAYVRFVGKEMPTVVYTSRLPIEIQPNEEHAVAMLRAVELLTKTMREEGIPALVRAIRKHSIDSILVSVDAPWQETVVHVEKIAQENAFVFTKRVVTETVQKVTPTEPGKVYVDASVVGTILNGYEMHDPYGKRVQHAKIIVLTSRMDEQVAMRIRGAVRGLSRTKHVALIAGTSLRYQAMRVAFQHEHDALILDATGPFPEVALVHKGFLVAAAEAPEGLIAAEGVTSGDLTRGLAELAKSYPLPRTIFLLARFDQMDAVKKALDSVSFGTLWLSDNPPRIIPLLTSHMAGLVKQMSTNPPDLPLLLMALYYRYLVQKP
jgi:hypothetical protein